MLLVVGEESTRQSVEVIATNNFELTNDSCFERGRLSREEVAKLDGHDLIIFV